MRRLTAALLAAPLAATAALAGCSSSSSPAQAGSNESVKVTGAEGKAPAVHIPAKKADTALVTKTLVPGHGEKLTPGDSYLANFDVFLWRGKTNKLLFSSFTSTPEVLPVTMGLTGLQKALTGERVGSRVLAVLPPKYGYGPQGNSQIGVKPGDTLVWVVDLLQAFPPNASASGKHVSIGGGKPADRVGRCRRRAADLGPQDRTAEQADRQDADQGQRRSRSGQAVHCGEVRRLDLAQRQGV